MVLLVLITAVLFSQRFIYFYGLIRRHQVSESFDPLVSQIEGKSRSDYPEIAQRFYENNQTFEFYIEDTSNGDVIYATPHADTSGDFTLVVAHSGDYSIRARSDTGLTELHGALVKQALGAFIVMLALCVICAFVFARQMTRPIKTLADAAKRMADLDEVPPLPERRDELGALAQDVHSMYGNLKETISKLEEEILRERELEETQRYFFSAASHELKTPIAAASVLLEGMLENVGDYEDHPKYLRECLKLMDVQNRVISEILEIVNLNNGKIVPVPEKLDVKCVVAACFPISNNVRGKRSAYRYRNTRKSDMPCGP
jgi:two-component system sensor histidine kinase VanS